MNFKTLVGLVGLVASCRDINYVNINNRIIEGDNCLIDRLNYNVSEGNVPPIPVLSCENRLEGYCIYKTKQDQEICVDGSNSYDSDGEIVGYYIATCGQIIVNPKNGVEGQLEPYICINANVAPGIYHDVFVVQDDKEDISGEAFFIEVDE